MKIFAICLFFLFSISINSQLLSKKENRLGNLENSFSLNTETLEQTEIFAQVKSEKDPFLAGTLSFIVPGAALGQLYNGQYLNWGIRFGISAACFGISYALSNSKKAPGIIAVALLVYAINWVSSIFDASHSAEEINLRERYRKKKK